MSVQVDIEDAYEALMDRVDRTLAETGDEFPFAADPDTGTWETTDDGNWCAGHWIGLLWFAATHANDVADTKRYIDAAWNHTDVLWDEMPRETMFCGMNFHHAGWLGFDSTSDRQLYAMGLEGADAMVDMFHEKARQIRVGTYRIKGPAEQFDMEREVEGRPTGEHVAVCDTIFTSLPILWRAYCETGETTFRDVAISHADRHMDWYLNPDGSTTHMVAFDPATGDPDRYFDTLAYDMDTCWARGQGWNIAGLSWAYDETDAPRYLDALEAAAKYYRTHTHDDLIPYWDFEDPRIPDVPKDTSAAALTAYGLLRLERDSGRTARLGELGEEILSDLVSEYMVTKDGPRRGMVTGGCYNYPQKYAYENELVWTDFYVGASLRQLID